jgi:hypothetical protein
MSEATTEAMSRLAMPSQQSRVRRRDSIGSLHGGRVKYGSHVR